MNDILEQSNNNKMSAQVPVLLILFNRSDNASQLIDALRLVKPREIYVNIDGPRTGNEKDRIEVALCKELVAKIDWECIISKQYHEKNLGCKNSVVAAIDWYFSNVDEGIILEDDCIPSASFFAFSAQMLTKYRDDNRVMQISGSNYVTMDDEPLETYYYSALNDIWGWATWKRAWSKFSLDMTGLDEFLNKGLLDIYVGNSEISSWLRAYMVAAKDPSSTTWSSQWCYAMAKQFAFTIVPPKNLVRNIGFLGEGSHSDSPRWNIYSSIMAEEIHQFKTPSFFSPNRELDQVRFDLIKITDPVFSWSSKLKVVLKKFIPDVILKLRKKLKS